VTVGYRRAAAALLAALGLVLALALARPAPAAAAPPSVRAPAAILVEPATGDVVFQRQARRERPVASTTKLMTALVTLEHAKLSKVLTTVPYHGLPAESVIGLRGGERMTVADLLRGLLLASANDAAATLAA
jgi:serine-type D-Ala-D-Ala carboxypeptidase (penicillin-binding protein 5/6)